MTLEVVPNRGAEGVVFLILLEACDAIHHRAIEPPDCAAVFPGLAEQFADARDDLAAVQVDGGHELVVGQARQAVLQVEPGGSQGAEVRGDLAGDGFR
jgi:hypothetical protein